MSHLCLHQMNHSIFICLLSTPSFDYYFYSSFTCLLFLCSCKYTNEAAVALSRRNINFTFILLCLSLVVKNQCVKCIEYESILSVLNRSPICVYMCWCEFVCNLPLSRYFICISSNITFLRLCNNAFYFHFTCRATFPFSTLLAFITDCATSAASLTLLCRHFHHSPHLINQSICLTISSVPIAPPSSLLPRTVSHISLILLSSRFHCLLHLTLLIRAPLG